MIEKDVLGQDKPKETQDVTKAKPNKIFIVLAVALIIAVIYWLVSNKG